MSEPVPTLLDAVAEHLVPLFRAPEVSRDAARTAARQAVASYHPQDAADYPLIGSILALSLASIAASVQAMAPDQPVTRQLRYLTKANTLSRAARQAEVALEKSRRNPPSRPAASPPAQAARSRDPVPAQPSPSAAPVRANPPQPSPAAPPASKSAPTSAHPASARPASAPIQPLLDQAMAEYAAIIAPEQNPAPRPASLRHALLQQTAITRCAAPPA